MIDTTTETEQSTTPISDVVTHVTNVSNAHSQAHSQ